MSTAAAGHAIGDRLLVVHDPGRLADLVRRRYRNLTVQSQPSFLSAIAACDPTMGGPVRHVLVGVDPAERRLSAAIGGLRRATGTAARVVLCCRPDGEPAARHAMAAGADDYVIYPPTAGDLDKALRLAGPAMPFDLPGAASERIEPAELSAVAEALADAEGGPAAMLPRLAEVLRASLQCTGLAIVAEGATAEAGEPMRTPTLAETIPSQGRAIGKILAGPREGLPYQSGDLDKLRHYATLIGRMLDVSQRIAALREIAMTDDLTGLPNRRLLLATLDATLARAARDRSSVTLLLFDIDDFKHYNDRYGHAAGDQVLRETSRLFRRCCRQQDVVARYGGDEFVVLFWQSEQPRVPGSRHPTDALDVLDRFRKELVTHEFTSLGPDGKGSLSISGGLASFPWDAQRASDLIAQADRALLRAKQDGKNRIYLVGRDTAGPTTAEGRPLRPFEARRPTPPADPSDNHVTVNECPAFAARATVRIDRVTAPDGAAAPDPTAVAWCTELARSPGVLWRLLHSERVQRTAWYRDHATGAPEAVLSIVRVEPRSDGAGLSVAAETESPEDSASIAEAMAEAIADYAMECQLNGMTGCAVPRPAERHRVMARGDDDADSPA